MNNAHDDLERLLGGPLPPGLAALSQKDLDALASTIADATRNQEAALAKAIDNGLNIVPKMLRGTVKKALFG